MEGAQKRRKPSHSHQLEDDAISDHGPIFTSTRLRRDNTTELHLVKGSGAYEMYVSAMG
jgi:hypothetical protein